MSQFLSLQERLKDFTRDVSVGGIFHGRDLEEAKNIGRAEGYDQGYQDALKTLEGQTQLALQQIDRHLEEWNRLKEHDIQVNVELLTLCLTQIFSVLKDSFLIRELEQIFAQFFHQIKSERPLRISANPAILPALQEKAQDWSTHHHVTFIGDDTLGEADVMVRWPEGEYKLGLSSAMNVMLEKIQWMTRESKEDPSSQEKGEENV